VFFSATAVLASLLRWKSASKNRLVTNYSRFGDCNWLRGFDLGRAQCILTRKHRPIDLHQCLSNAFEYFAFLPNAQVNGRVLDQ
jgi:hypothetical protein